MKHFLLLFFILEFSSKVYSIDYYYYKGKKIELDSRDDKLAIILNNNYPEEFVKSEITKYLRLGDVIKKNLPDVYLINFKDRKSEIEIDHYLYELESQTDILKFATKVFYGTTKRITQVPSDKFIVKLKNISDIEKLNAFNIENNCIIIGKTVDENCFVLKTTSGVDKNALELSEIYYTKGLFDYCEPDFLYPEGCLLLSNPNDQYFPLQWGLSNTGQLIQTGSPFLLQGDASVVNGIPGADMNVLNAWEYTTGSASVRIGIIDSGIDSVHEDFQSPNHLLSGYDAINNVNSSSSDVFDHGTSVAGLIGAVKNNSTGIAGIAPDCQLMSIAIYDINGYTENSVIARAFDTARVRGIDILCNSWGGITPSSTITNAIDNAATNGRNGLGCIILFASGNDGSNPPVYPSYLQNVISVGASTPHDQKKTPGTGNQFYWGSNYGEDINGDLDLTAPTNNYSMKIGGYNPNFWGTSASCANASGVAALILSVNTSQNRLQVFQNLLRGCDKTDNVSYSANKEFGKWNYYYGYGRINALNSIRLASGIDITPPTINHINITSHSSTYPTNISADITDQDGTPIPFAGFYAPKIFYRIKKNGGSWTAFDSSKAITFSGNEFKFKIPSQGWETEIQYFIRASDIYGNKSEFPIHAPNPYSLCYYTIGDFTSVTKKIPSFAGADYGPTLSPSVSFDNFKITDVKVKIYMRHTWLADEIIQIFAPIPDANINRKCLFSSNGGDMDNIYGATVSDFSTIFWKDDFPSYWNGYYKPEINLRGLNGQNANGNWRILHFDRGIGDYAFFDSVLITLNKTSGITSSSVRFDSPEDSIIYFDSVTYSNIYEKDFYLKNSGTSGLQIFSTHFSGENASLFSIVSQIPSSILPNDSGLFRIRLNSSSINPADNIENAVLNIETNDPSKNLFQISLQTSDSIFLNIKNLHLSLLTEGLYSTELDSTFSDSVNIFLRNENTPFELIDSARGFLNTQGNGNFTFYNTGNKSSYFIAVKHRNSIETWSSNAEAFTGQNISYNFTIDSSQAFGNNLTLKGQKFCIYSGDVDQNGFIDISDLALIDSDAFNFTSGYVITDLNGDSFTDLSDYALADNNAAHFIARITP